MNRYEMMSSGWWAVYDDDGGRLLCITKYLTTEETALAGNGDATLSGAASQLSFIDSDVAA